MSEISLSNIRTDYKKAALRKNEVAADPFLQFKKWFEEVLHSKVEEPNAMTLATADRNLKPSARIVLLKGIDDKGFYFYTNYDSRKGKELAENPRAALVFFWKELERQVRVEGLVKKATAKQSDAYFLSRPKGSQTGAWASPQSQVIDTRDVLEEKVKAVEEQFKGQPLHRPDFWGGYCLEPEYMEFWQGRSNRLHDRIIYIRKKPDHWQIKRLAP